MITRKYKLVSVHPRKSHNLNQAAELAQIFGKDFLHITSIYFSPVIVKLVKKISSGLGIQIGKRSHYKLPGKFVRLL